MTDPLEPTPMSPTEFKVIRRGLGVTVPWLADHLGVAPRTIERWQAGRQDIPPRVAEALAELEAAAAEEVAAEVELLRGRPLPAGQPPVLHIEPGPDAGWLEMIAWRVRQEVPEVVISLGHDGAEEAPPAAG